MYFSKVLKHILIWIAAFYLFTFLREYGQNVEEGLARQMTDLEYFLFPLLIGSIAGVLFGSYAFLISRFLAQKFSFGRSVFITSVGYVIVILSLIFIGFNAFTSLFDLDMDSQDLQRFFSQGNHRVLIVYCFIVGFLIEFIQEVDRKFGPGNLWKMLRGKYYRPIEEERVLMFLDMRSSTTIAEKLGHIRYSLLVQDCFKDISVVAQYKGQVYQYVGDEAVLTWEGDSGFHNNNCIKAYFAFCDQIHSRKDYYMLNYGLIPEFKAGINAGVITTAEVGDIKREIAFHGDTINTAARIQAMCNDLGHDFLASRSVINRLSESVDLMVDSVGELSLKGKKEQVEILAINRR